MRIPFLSKPAPAQAEVIAPPPPASIPSTASLFEQAAQRQPLMRAALDGTSSALGVFARLTKLYERNPDLYVNYVPAFESLARVLRKLKDLEDNKYARETIEHIARYPMSPEAIRSFTTFLVKSGETSAAKTRSLASSFFEDWQIFYNETALNVLVKLVDLGLKGQAAVNMVRPTREQLDKAIVLPHRWHPREDLVDALLNFVDGKKLSESEIRLAFEISGHREVVLNEKRQPLYFRAAIAAHRKSKDFTELVLNDPAMRKAFTDKVVGIFYTQDLEAFVLKLEGKTA